MSALDSDIPPPPRLAALIAALEARGRDLAPDDCAVFLEDAELAFEDVAPFVQERAQGYARRRIARTEQFEMLVMTWRPGQASVPHDHAGSACTLRVLRGAVTETRFRLARDGMVDPHSSSSSYAGDFVEDPRLDIHLLANDAAAPEVLVTLHVYSPPLPELRRYVPRPAGTRPAPAFERSRSRGAKTVAIVGGGFSGTMVAAHLLRRASESGQPLHVVLFDRHSSFGEGAAYRTAETSHLLNVPAARMSAWPDQPEGFLAWARARDPRVGPGDFLPRRTYGEYVRATFLEAAARAGERVTADIRQEEIIEIVRRPSGALELSSATGTVVEASAVVLATGHRAPDDPLADRWTGSRSRWVPDPWASLALTAIAHDEPVVVLGTGLTTVDVLLTLSSREGRTAPVLAISRRGLLPEIHAPTPVVPIDPSAWVEELSARPGGLSARALLRAVRDAVDRGLAHGHDWRAVIDGLRPHTGALWRSLSSREAGRFLRHVRAFWEVRRHRMAPEIGRTVATMAERGTFQAIAARVIGARGDASGVTLEIRRRGSTATETIRASWVINCTGPGGDLHNGREPMIASLIDGGQLVADPLGLGVLAGARGEAIDAAGREQRDLVVVGTMRRAQLWESTAVPELRGQAEGAADAVLRHLDAVAAQGAIRA
jgi:uncharacterized NAD(P)/FAD-binding protein YdhS/predicted metal-dependent enzyme (double-stranded beta helix superfamily)